MKAIKFTTSSLPIVPFEDDDVNPRILGRGLANWVKESLVDSQYEITEDIPEDWGYCLMVRRKPYWLWVGCVGLTKHTFPERGLSAEVAESIPPKSIIWNLWVTTEMGLIGRLLRTDDRSKESAMLMELLDSRIKLLHDFDRLA